MKKRMRSRAGRWALLASCMVLAMSIVGSAAAGKTVLKAADNPPSLLTPGKMTTNSAQVFAGMVYDWLVRVEPGSQLQLVPELARSWSMSPDGKTWTLSLRRGVTFHNGASFTADDVVYTVKRMLDPELGHPLRSDLGNLEGIEATDAYTVTFHLSDANPKFLYLFTDYNAPMLSHQYDYEAYGESKPMGTGPFMVQNLQPGERCVLVRNPDYWMEGAPRLDEIHWVWVPEKSTQIMMLESGDVHFTGHISPVDAQRILSLEHLTYYPVRFQENRVIYMRADRPPFDDNRVRLAVKYALDYPTLLDLAFGDLAQDVVVIETPIAPLFSEYVEQPARAQDLGKARHLLAEAGYSDGLDIDLYYAANLPPNQELALTIQEMLRPAGIRVHLMGLPRDIYLSKHWLKIDFGITGWAQRLDPITVLNLAYRSDGPWNESHFENPRVDELITEIRSSLDPAEREELYAELQHIFHDQGPIVVISKPILHGLSRRVDGFVMSIAGMGDWRWVDLEPE